MADASALLSFYDGTGRDAAGRTLAEILAWNDTQLEAVHDYIQWLFPLPESSAFNPAAPRLTKTDVAAFRDSPERRERLRAALLRMLRFYRLDGSEPGARHWLTPGNHNFLRLTRIVRCLHLLGLRTDATDLLLRLERLYAEGNSHIIGARTLDFWRSAVR